MLQVDSKQMANMVKRFRVTFDSQKENAFLVHMQQGVINFAHEATTNLYVRKLPPKRVRKYSMVNTAEENMKFHSKREIAQHIK